MVIDLDVSWDCLNQFPRQIIESNTIDFQSASSPFQIVADQDTPLKLIVIDYDGADGELLWRLLADLENFLIVSDLQ